MQYGAGLLANILVITSQVLECQLVPYWQLLLPLCLMMLPLDPLVFMAAVAGYVWADCVVFGVTACWQQDGLAEAQVQFNLGCLSLTGHQRTAQKDGIAKHVEHVYGSHLQ